MYVLEDHLSYPGNHVLSTVWQSITRNVVEIPGYLILMRYILMLAEDCISIHIG